MKYPLVIPFLKKKQACTVFFARLAAFRFASRSKSLRSLSVLLVSLSIGLSAVTAQDANQSFGQIEGRVFNEFTQRYVEQAVVVVEGTSLRAYTNSFGEYRLRNVPVGAQTVIAEYTGLERVRERVRVEAQATARQDFKLVRRRGEEEFVYELEEFVVSGSDFQTMQELAVHQERHSVNLKNVVSTEAYGLVGQGNVGEFVKFIPGVTIGYGGSNTAGGTYSSGADANTIQIRGYSARETTITIDGMPIANAAPGTLDPAVGLDMMSINNASRVEVIKVPSPDQPNAGVGGTVNLVSLSAFEYPKPTFKFRAYLSMNSEQLDFFSKSPGPMDKPTYKTLPSVEMTYALPINDRLGVSITASSINQANANYTLKSRIQRYPEDGRPSRRSSGSTFSLRGETYSYWLLEDEHLPEWQAQYGEDWTQWTEDDFYAMYSETGASEALVRARMADVKRLPKYDLQGNLVGTWSANDLEDYNENLPLYRNEAGEIVGRVFSDWGHPYINRVQVTDSPRISERNSGAVKVDFRPFDGVIVSANYQVSTFKDQDANRRVHKISGTPIEYGPNYLLSETGGVRLDTDAFGREGITHSAYIKASYIKGPWEISASVSRSQSESDLLSEENGHFSVIQVNMGGIDYTEFLDISKDGVPAEVNYYKNIVDADGNVTGRELIDIGKLSNYSISNFDPNNPDAGTLKVRSGGIHAESTVDMAKFDVRRELDFIPGPMHLAIKLGADWERKENVKSGRGSNYEYVYLGQEGQILSLGDFRDENYVGVDPGFGLDPLEWPDPYALYRYAQENPGAFSDTDDTVPSGTGAESVAGHNYLEEANTSKAITEETIAYYAQLEGDFFNNRLSIVGGFRMSESERSGYDRGQDNYWNYLHFNEDGNGDGILDVFKDYTDISIDSSYGVDYLDLFDVTSPSILVNALRRERVATFDDLKADTQASILKWYGYYEQAGAVYADGQPFIADEFVRVIPGSLQARRYQYIKNFPIDQKAQGKPQPIISAAYDITDNLVARVSWSTTYSNPPYESSEGAGGTLRRVEFFEEPDGSGSMFITNPDLKVSKTQGWDVGLSYYTESGGKYSITLYHRTENDRPVDVFYSRSGSQAAWEGLMQSLGYGPGSYFYDNNWSVNTSVNAQGTFIDYGYELEMQQDLGVLGKWGKYFYFYGTFFQQYQKLGSVPEDEQGDFTIPLSNDMRLNASGGLNFRYKRLQLRINATWRNARTLDEDDALIDGIFWPDPTVGNPGWFTPEDNDDDSSVYTQRLRLEQPESLRVDFSGSFKINEHLSFDFSARNITEDYPEPIYILEGGGTLPFLGHLHDGTEKSLYGVNFTIGISGTY
jgi:TonB-dependent receptor